jgi:3-deoxy-manno-octulosonate cytidylyltransferase (CMP-KDO synthetase)
VSVLALIPARYASSRFPGKPLIDLKGKPMIQRVWEQAMKAKSLDAVAVATDDLRIKRVVESFGGLAIMTPVHCVSGTDRIAIAVQNLKKKPSIVVNVQGDEPLLPPQMIDQLVNILKKSDAPMATLCRPLEDRAEYLNPNAVKVVIDKVGKALYFSRAAVPLVRDSVGAGRWPARHPGVGLHIGIYAYRADFLQKLARFRPTPLEMTEKLEQLRVLENGFEIAVGQTRLASHAIDTPQDAARVRKLIR